MMIARTIALAAVLSMAAIAPAAPAGDVSASLTVRVFPTEVSLTNSNDYQNLIVQGVQPDGVTHDLTKNAKFSIENASLARLDNNIVHPVADGETKVVIEAAGQKLTVPLKVKDAKVERPISFRLDIMPVFSKAGCNTGSCHGAARGKDGFHLSLFGYDPANDYHNITRQFPGRRINLALPDDSLLLTKSIGVVQHTGGEPMTRDSHLYATLQRWLKAGAPDDKKDVATVTGLTMLPKQAVLDGEGATQQVTVIASYSNGATRDVTNLAAFITSNESSAAVSPEGVITGAQRGEAFVMARFDAFTEGAQIIVVPRGLKYEAPPFPANNYIDELIAAKLQKLRIIPADLCSDEVFLRRATIDIIGKVPTPEEYAAFAADTDSNKREKVVDELLERKEFVDVWVMKFSELLQIRSSPNLNRGISYKSAVLYHGWLTEQLQNNVPMNRIVQDLIGANGSTFANPAANFYQVERDNLKLSENVAQIFMGMRMQCAQCHNHPFDRWTMDDYYGFAAFFTQIGRKRGLDARDQIIYNSGRGEARNPLGNRVMKPRFLGGKEPELSRDDDRREVLAQWLASPENPFFAKNLANMVWAHFFGRGIVDPVDDVRISNPPSNPELLEALGDKFTAYNYDFKKLVRDICTSRTYQLATTINETNELDTTNFSRAYIRRVRAEVLYDMISQVTDTEDKVKFRGLPQGAHAVQIADGNTTTYFLTTFGRATRETVCSCEVKMEPNLSQALHLLNGDTVQEKVRQGGLIKQMLDAKKTPEQIIEALYVQCLSRKPTGQEMQSILAGVKNEDPKQQAEALEDVFWAILNTKEFLFNH